MKESSSLVKWIFLVLLILPYVSISQKLASREMIDRAVDRYCECVTLASNKSDLLKCDLGIDTTSVKLSETDKFYIPRRIIKQCGEAQTRFYDHNRDLKFTSNFLLMGCTCFNEDDLGKFSLRRDSSSFIFYPIVHETWLPHSNDKSGSLILKLEQYRQIIEEKDMESWINNEQRALKASEVAHHYFDFFSIVSQEEHTNEYQYSIVTREVGLICGLTIVLKEKDSGMVNELVELLVDKVRECDL